MGKSKNQWTRYATLRLRDSRINGRLVVARADDDGGAMDTYALLTPKGTEVVYLVRYVEDDPVDRVTQLVVVREKNLVWVKTFGHGTST